MLKLHVATLCKSLVVILLISLKPKQGVRFWCWLTSVSDYTLLVATHMYLLLPKWISCKIVQRYWKSQSVIFLLKPELKVIVALVDSRQ